MVRSIDPVVAVWPIGRVRGTRVIQLSDSIKGKLFPEKENFPTPTGLRRMYVRETNDVISNQNLRKSRLYNFPRRIIPPLGTTGGLPIYATSVRRLREGYLIGILIRKPLIDVYF